MCVGGRRLQSIALSALQSSALQKPSNPAVLEGLTSSAFNFNSSIESVENVKAAPKRRRKPQKPGKTAKNNDRHFVVHHYLDHSQDVDGGECSHHVGSESSSSEEEGHHRRRGGVSVPFPVKLHEVLDQVEADGFAHIISWQGHGRCFMIHKPKEFVDYIMPRYFRQSKLTSFQRQLNLYGFNRITRGPDSGAYYSEYFLRWRVFLCKYMIRTKVKGTRFKAASNPENEPDFYSMPVVMPMASESSSCGDSQHTLSTSDSTLSVVPLPSKSFNLEQISYDSTLPNTQAISSSLNQFLSNYRREDSPIKNQVPLNAVTSNDWNDSNNSDDLDDFSIDWSETFDTVFESSLNDDVQLSYMLEKLLED